MLLIQRRASSTVHLLRTVGFTLSVFVFVVFWPLAFNFGLSAVFRVWLDPALADTTHFVHNLALHAWVWVWGVAMLVQLLPTTRAGRRDAGRAGSHARRRRRLGGDPRV